MFAVDRVLTLRVTNLPCQMPLGFNVEESVKGARTVMRGGTQIELELRLDRKTSALDKNRTWHPNQKATRVQDGCLTLTLQDAYTPELFGWMLSFGQGIRVMRPPSLQQEVK